MTLSIPNIVMQTYKSQESLPDHWLYGQSTVKNQLYHFKYVFMTDEDMYDLMRKHFPQYNDEFVNLEYKILQVDIVRYAFLYLYGGLYIDLDYEMNSDLSKYFVNGDIFLLPSSNNNNIYTNSVMASKPKMDFWLKVLEECFHPSVKLPSWNKDLYILTRTGPNMLTRVVQKTSTSVVKLPVHEIQPYSVCSDCNRYRNTVLVPLEGSSWIDPTKKTFYHFFYCHPILGSLLIIGIILIFVFIFYMCFRKRPKEDVKSERKNLKVRSL